MIPKNVLPLSTCRVRPNTQLESIRSNIHRRSAALSVSVFSGGIGNGEGGGILRKRCDLVRLIPHAALFRLLALMFTADGPFAERTRRSRIPSTLDVFRQKIPYECGWLLAMFSYQYMVCLLGRQVA